MARAEEKVAVARGKSKAEARGALKDIQGAHRDLLVRRDKATQQQVLNFDHAKAYRLYASSVFCHAVDDLCVPESVADAVLAIH